MNSLEGKNGTSAHRICSQNGSRPRPMGLDGAHAESRKGIVSGDRLLAISRAEKVIDAWYQRKGHLQASVPKVNYA
jgi:hypothetical protein